MLYTYVYIIYPISEKTYRMALSTIWDGISLSTLLLYVIPVIFYLQYSTWIHLKGTIIMILLTIVSESLKNTILKHDLRPFGARDCNGLCNDGDQSGKPGMPSTHTAIASFFAYYYSKHTTNIYIQTGLITYAGLVALSRYMKKCHSIPQIIVGALLGGWVAYLA